MLRVISAGHPGGLIIRDGAVVRTLPTPTALPVSMGDLRAPEVVEESLQPGDHVLLYTDGVTEARTEDGEFFGVDRLAAVRGPCDGGWVVGAGDNAPARTRDPRLPEQRLAGRRDHSSRAVAGRLVAAAVSGGPAET